MSAPTDDSDLALVRRALARDAAAVDALATRLACVPRFIRVLSARQGLNKDQAEDLAQEAISIVWQRLPSFRGEAALESWTFKICEFLLRNAARKQHRRRLPTGAEELDDVADVTTLADDDRADGRMLLAALDGLEPAYAAVIRLRYLDGLTMREIADRLAIPLGTVKTRFYAAIEELRARVTTPTQIKP